jgi:hypothetical protein
MVPGFDDVCGAHRCGETLTYNGAEYSRGIAPTPTPDTLVADPRRGAGGGPRRGSIEAAATPAAAAAAAAVAAAAAEGAGTAVRTR